MRNLILEKLNRKLDLQNFALANADLTDGAGAVTAQIYELSIDKDGTGMYMPVCSIELTETFNEEIITRYTLCGEGAASNNPGGQDYEIPFDILQIKDTADLSNFLYKNKHNQNARVGLGIRLDNTLMNVRTEFNGAIILDTAGGAAEDMANISGTIKPYKGVLNVIDPIPGTPLQIKTTSDEQTVPNGESKTQEEVNAMFGVSAIGGDGNYTYTNNVSTIITDWTSAGDYTVTLTVTDGTGAVSTKDVKITISA